MFRVHTTLLLPLLLVLVASSHAQAPAPSAANVGIGLSVRSVQNALQAKLFPAIESQLALVSSELPPYCCYDNVEVKHVHLMIQNIAMPTDQILATGTANTSSAGLDISMDVSFDFNFFLRLCLHTFGGCSTLFHCKGDVALIIDAKVDLTIAFSADPNTGMPVLTAVNPLFTLAVPQMAGLCSDFQKGINDELPKINAQVNAKLGPALDQALAQIVADIPTSIPVGDAYSLVWALTTQSGTDSNGINAMAAAALSPAAGGGPSAPFVPSPALPSASSLLNSTVDAAVVLSDALINNAIFTVYSASNWTFVTTSNGTTITLSITESPQLHFTSQPGANATFVNITGMAKIQQGLLRAQVDFGAVAHAGVSINASGYFVLVLSSALDVSLSNPRPPFPTKPLASAIEAAWASASADINAELQQNAPLVPLIGSVTSESIIINNGYALFLAQSGGGGSAELEAASAFLTKAVVSSALPATTLPCPDLSSIGAHQDDCTFG